MVVQTKSLSEWFRTCKTLIKILFTGRKEKHCNADGHKKRPNKKPGRKMSDEKEMRGQISEIPTTEEMLDGAQDNLKSGTSLQKKEDTDVAAQSEIHIPHPSRQVVECKTGISMELSSFMVFWVSDKIRIAVND